MPVASKHVLTPDIPIPEVLEKVRSGETTESFLLTGETGKEGRFNHLIFSIVLSLYKLFRNQDLYRIIGNKTNKTNRYCLGLCSGLWLPPTELVCNLITSFTLILQDCLF